MTSWKFIREQERTLGQRFLDGLPDAWTLHGPPTMEGRVSTFAITHAEESPEAAAERLAEAGFAVYHGNYYALEVMKRLGLPDGAIRVGIVHYNTEDEVDGLLRRAATVARVGALTPRGLSLVECERRDSRQLEEAEAHWLPVVGRVLREVAVPAPDEQRPVGHRGGEVACLLQLAPVRPLHGQRVGGRLVVEVGLVGDERHAEVERILHEAPHLGLAEVPQRPRRKAFAVRAGGEPPIEGLHREVAHPEPVRDRQQPPADLSRADAAPQPVVRLVRHQDLRAREADLEQLLGRQQVHARIMPPYDRPVAKTDYSGTPLSKKLGAKPGAEVVVFFTTRRAELLERLPRLTATLAPADGLWIAWPKKASKLETDLDFDAVQRAGLDAGLVDNKSCAIDEEWQALRFVYRLADRR